ncbi:D-glycero-beta-D-manno-heptose 1,7-bisphosphate 7-phosphatase [Mangrovibrevibacter kandeliae]|uniref:D-glycero-beta-D-manno-heptose 1,7-bisphosphate 7-phosphatase n=1 Tax=Mangrovibrevibacter kandeliae TaxID=2968473 RepID=UPI002117AC11|nr:D-glycero-beta-D-manno-heptose 1,7-bisphosphate 7-phosphatase [Aurantimonas sp. CSK15Z-1]MCQ8782826.1 D-glycero-beta-D-manno-heptose 1,7-bisphosphate 7-phosphatase [Aurantimonas sp. CSK15Z-1]
MICGPLASAPRLPSSGPLRPALFLDRDGVVNLDTDFVSTREAFVFQDGIFDLVRDANAADHAVVVVTNQSGIARGLFSEATFHTLTQWMIAVFADNDAPLSRVYYCPFHPAAKVERFRGDHPWRKPAPGMLLAAAADLGLDLARSALVGDRWSDAGAAEAAGLGEIVLVGNRADTETPPPVLPPVTRLPAIKDARARFAARAWRFGPALDVTQHAVKLA